MAKLQEQRWFGWLIAILAMTIVMVSNGMVNTGLTVYDESLINQFGWSVGELKTRDTITFAVSAVLIMVAGSLVDRYGTKPLILAGMAMLSVGFVLYSMIGSLTDVYLLHIGLAVALACSGNMAGIVTAATWLPQRRGIAIGIAIAGTSVGGMLVPPFANWLNQTYGWQLAMRIEALVPLTLLLVVFFLLPAGKPKRNAQQTEDSSNDENEGIPYRQVLRSPSFYLIAAAGAMTYYAILGIFQHLFLYMRSHDFEPSQAALAFTVLSFPALCAKLFSGWLADKVNAVMLFQAVMVLMTIGAIGIAQVPEQIWLFLVLTGLGWGSLHTLYNFILIKLYGLLDAGKINATISFAEGAGGALGILLTGVLYDLTSSYALPFGVIAALMVTGTILIILLGRFKQTRLNLA